MSNQLLELKLNHFYSSMCCPETPLPYLWTSHAAFFTNEWRDLRLCPSSQKSFCSENPAQLLDNQPFMNNESNTFSQCEERSFHRIPSLVSITHVGLAKTTCNSSSRVFDVFFWPLWTLHSHSLKVKSILKLGKKHCKCISNSW